MKKDKIEVGEYIRTKEGQIYKIEDGTEFYEDSVDVGIGIIPDVDGIWVDKGHYNYVDKRNIKAHSKNIIDLIEVGDYVNGEKVNKNKYGELYIGYVYAGGEIGKTLEPYATFIEDIKEEYIETIVTKEQFKEMEYRV